MKKLISGLMSLVMVLSALSFTAFSDFTETSGGVKYEKDDGTFQTGWLEENGEKYYFDKDGIMLTGLQKVDSTYYYFSSKGEMKTGTIKTKGYIYRFDSKTGKVKAKINGWVTLSGKKYYCVKSKYSTGLTEITESGKKNTYYFNTDGTMATSKTVEAGLKSLKINSSGIVYDVVDNSSGLKDELKKLEASKKKTEESIKKFEDIYNDSKTKSDRVKKTLNEKIEILKVTKRDYSHNSTKMYLAENDVEFYEDLVDEWDELLKDCRSDISECQIELSKINRRIKEINKLLGNTEE